MIELFEQDIRTENRQSSKGNQLKWLNDEIWYKADYAGYEGLAEYMVSKLLQYSNLEQESFVLYDTEQITGLRGFGVYMSKLLALDAFFLNADRHTHNIAVLMDGMGDFRYCPVFDNGAALLSDTTMDYPLNVDVNRLIGNVKPSAYFTDFTEQLDIAEQLYGQNVRFSFRYEDVHALLEKEAYYPNEVKERVAQVIMEQRRKYSYLFC